MQSSKIARQCLVGSCLVLVLLDVKLFRRPMCILPAAVLFHCQRGVPCILLLGRHVFPSLASLCSFLPFVTLRTMGHTDPRPVALQASSLDNILMLTSVTTKELFKSIIPVILECLEHTTCVDL